MGIMKHIRSILPLPKAWDNDNDLKAFALRIEQSLRELFARRVTGIRKNGHFLSSRADGTVDIGTFGDAAEMDVANNLTTTEEGSVLDARQGKALNDSVVHLAKTETITGQKNFSGNTYFMNHTISPRLYFNGSLNEDQSGMIWLSNAGTGAEDKYSNAQFIFYEYSPASNGSRTSYYEAYRLPAVDTGRTASTTLDILTTKNAVTVDQGGTGADNADDARINLGLGSLEYVDTIGGTTSGSTYTKSISGTKHYLIYAYRNANVASMGLYLLKTRMATSGTNYYNLVPVLASSAISSIEVTTSSGSANGTLKMTSAATNTYIAIYRIL